MAGRPCLICSDSRKLKLAADLIAQGVIDREIAERLGLGSDNNARMCVARHRVRHIEKPARAIVEMANKGRDVRQEREKMLAAAEAGDPSAYLALSAIVSDLRKVQERLERTADAAEQGGQRLAVASLSAQQLRASEVRARLAGHGGYAAQKAQPGEVPAFSLTINLGTRTERLTMGAPPTDEFTPPTIDLTPAAPIEPTIAVSAPDAEDDQPIDLGDLASRAFGHP